MIGPRQMAQPVGNRPSVDDRIMAVWCELWPWVHQRGPSGEVRAPFPRAVLVPDLATEHCEGKRPNLPLDAVACYPGSVDFIHMVVKVADTTS